MQLGHVQCHGIVIRAPFVHHNYRTQIGRTTKATTTAWKRCGDLLFEHQFKGEIGICLGIFEDLFKVFGAT